MPTDNKAPAKKKAAVTKPLVEATKPSMASFMAAVSLSSNSDLINYGKIQKKSMKAAYTLAIELEEAYNELLD